MAQKARVIRHERRLAWRLCMSRLLVLMVGFFLFTARCAVRQETPLCAQKAEIFAPRGVSCRTAHRAEHQRTETVCSHRQPAQTKAPYQQSARTKAPCQSCLRANHPRFLSHKIRLVWSREWNSEAIPPSAIAKYGARNSNPGQQPGSGKKVTEMTL